MDHAWLQEQLAAGRSIESLARELGKDPSTVGYWVAKHGLTSSHAMRHAPRGGIERETLESLVAQGLSVRAIAGRLGLSLSTVRHWLERYGLVTARARRGRSMQASLGPCHHGGRVPQARQDDFRPPAPGKLALPPLPFGPCDRAPAAGEADTRVRSRGSLCPLRLRPRCGGPALPPCRPGGEVVSSLLRRSDEIDRFLQGGGGQVRAPVRELPRRGRERSRYHPERCAA